MKRRLMFAAGVIVRFRMTVYDIVSGSIGEIVSGEKDLWNVLPLGGKAPVSVLGICLERLSLYPENIRAHSVYSLLLPVAGCPAGTTVSVSSRYGEQATVQLPTTSRTIVPTVHLGRASVAAKVRHFFTR